MIIRKISLPRRTVLRGFGVTLALPFLEAMVPALTALAQSPAKRPSRLGFIYLPNGVAMNHTGVNFWKPAAQGTLSDLSPILSPLAPFKDRMLVVSGLTHAQAEALGDGNGDHTRGTCTWLNGVHPKKTEGADVRAGITADQIAADQIGRDVPLRSLELATIDLDFSMVGNCDAGYACAYLNAIAWRTPTAPLPPETNPRVVFERLFGDGGTPSQQLARVRKDRSILDWVTRQMARLQGTLGPGDRVRATEYFDAVRDVEQRIHKIEAQGAESLPTLERPLGIPEKFDDYAKLMFDLQWLAYQTDITRVFTLMLGRELSTRSYPEIGIFEPHHGLSHHRDDPEQLRKYAKLNTFQTELFAYFLEKLRATPDGDGTLLDHSLLLYGAGLSNPHVHSHFDLPLAVVGGASTGLKGGRHLACDPGTPMANLLVSMLDKVGIRTENLGDNSGRLELELLSEI